MTRFQFPILLSLIILFIGAEELFAQRVSKINHPVTGCYVANDRETPEEAKKEALFKAKENAMVEAGVWQDIYSISIMEINGSGERFTQINSELARFRIAGSVRLNGEPSYSERPVNGLHEYCATIDADVKVVEGKEDLMFDFETKGLRNTYLEGEKMTFTIIPTSDCYLRIFYFDQSAKEQLYPIKGTYKDVQFKANQPVSFPLPHDLKYLDDDTSRARDYYMGLTNKNNDFEQGVLIIIALKKPYRFTREVSYENVLDWLFNINRNEKKEHWFGVNIARR